MARRLALAGGLVLILSGSSGCLSLQRLRDGAVAVKDGIVSAVKWLVLPGAEGQQAPIEAVGGLLNYIWPGATAITGAIAGWGSHVWGQKRKVKRAEKQEWRAAAERQAARQVFAQRDAEAADAGSPAGAT